MAAAVAALLALGVGIAARGVSGGLVPAAPVVAAVLLALCLGAGRLAGGTLRPALSAGFATAAPLLCLACLFDLADPLVASFWMCGTGMVGVWLLGPFLFAGAAGAGALAGSAASGARLPAAIPWLVLAAGAVALAGLLLAAGGRAGRPTPATFVASIPVVGTLPPTRRLAEGSPFSCGTQEPGVTAAPVCAPGFDCAEGRCVREDFVAAAGLAFRRSCGPSGDCALALLPEADDTPGWERVSVQGREPLSVRRDPRHGIVIVGDQVAFDLGTRAPVDVTVHRVSDSLSPPLGWSLGGAAGVLVALLSALAALGARRRRARLCRAREGRVDAEGGILFEDGWEPLRVRATTPLTPGPVLALPTGPVLPPSYRAAGGGATWQGVAGSRAEVLERLRLRERGLAAVGIAATWLFGAPLVAAWVAGLLG